MKENDTDSRTDELQREKESLSEQVKRLIKAEGKLYRYQEELDAQLKEYKDLYELNRKLNTTSEIEKIFEYAVTYATKNLEYEKAVLLEWRERSGGYHVVALDGYYNKREKEAVGHLAIAKQDLSRSPLLSGAEYIICKTDSQEEVPVDFRSGLGMGEYFIFRLGAFALPAALLVVGNSKENTQYYRNVDRSALLSIGNMVGLVSSSLEKNIYFGKMELALDQEKLAEEKYRGIFENAVEGFFQTTPSGRFLSANPAMARMIGYSSPAELLAGITDINRQLYVDPERRFEFRNILERHETVEAFDVRCYRKDGSEIWVSMSARVVRNDTGQVLYYEGTAEDITERKRAEKALRDSEERYRVITESALDAIITMDQESTIVFTNPAVERIFGYTSGELHGNKITMLMPERLRQAHLNAVKRYITTGKRRLPWDGVEMTGLHRDGREIPLELTYGEFVKNGKYFFVGFIRDVSERKRAEEKIKYQAYHDLLTGLPNKEMFSDRLRYEISQMQRLERKLGVLFLDIDQFKDINDSLGHAAGDVLIRNIADRLKNSIRGVDTVARIGGDEFTMLLPLMNRPEDGSKVAQKIMKSFKKPYVVNGHELSVTASAGISIYPEDGEDADSLLKNADIALHYAKNQGRNNYKFYNASINYSTVERIILQNRLRKAVTRGELVVHYQPQRELKTGKITGAEALVRWRHPELGLLRPSQFIPLAEESGSIIEIDQWVFRTVCEQLKAWEKAGLGPRFITTNLSASQFQQPNLQKIIKKILKQTEVSPEQIGIEITETVAMQDTELTARNVKKLSDMGLRFLIDDFGTGYSSLSYLKKLPIYKLKIDQSFMSNLEDDRDYQAITNAIIAMAHILKLKVVAEGVETEEQRAFLDTRDCDEMQGNLFSKPIPAEEFEKLLV